MKAKVGYWSMSYREIHHSWTVGQNYEVIDNGDTLTVQSNGGVQEVPKVACNPDLFREVFGVLI